MEIQEIFNGQNETINIPCGEYKGPLVINKKCVIEGNNSTIWAKDTPALMVEADGIIIKNLKVELTKNEPHNIAVICKKNNVIFDNVEIFGEIETVDNKISHWDIPRVLDLGEFKANTENVFTRKIVLNNNSEIINNIYNLKITPQKFNEGENVIELKIPPLNDNIIIYGNFAFKADNGIIKRVYISGKAKQSAPAFNEKITNFISSVPSIIASSSSQKITTPYSFSVPEGKTIVKGARMLMEEKSKNSIAFASETLQDKVDPYIFLLNEEGKATSDSNIVFFGNPNVSGISLEEKNGFTMINLELKKIPHSVKKMAITFAVYEEDGNKAFNFHSVKNPKLLFYVNDKVEYNFPLELNLEKAINAIEIYRHKGIWKANFVGAGFNNGIRGLCQMYGIDVK